MGGTPKLNKEEKQLELEVLDYMDLFCHSETCIELLLKASVNHKIKMLVLLTKFKRQDYLAPDNKTPLMLESQARQRVIAEKLIGVLLEEFRLERNLSVLIIELATLRFFIEHTSLEGLTLNEEFTQIFNTCAFRISHRDLNKLSD